MRERVLWPLVIAGFCFLITAAYIDSIRGPVIPIVASQLSLSYGPASWMIVVGNILAIPALLLCFPLLNKYGERVPAIAATSLAVVAVLWAFWIHSLRELLIVGALLGTSVAIFGMLCNVLVIRAVPAQNRARSLCGLHLMFGVGSFIAPLALSAALENGITWQWALSAGLVLLIPGLFGLFSIGKTEDLQAVEHQAANLTWIQVKILAGMASYVGGEVVASMWMASYLVGGRGLSVIEASQYVAAFFVVMSLSRLLCFFSLKDELIDRLSWFSLSAGILFFTLGHMGFIWAFPLAGLVGPYFPVHLAQINRSFPKQWRSMTVWAILSMQGVLGLGHLVMGQLADQLGIRLTYLFPLVLFGLALVSLIGFLKMEQKTTRA